MKKYILALLFLFIPSLCFGAMFVTNQNGDFQDGAQWRYPTETGLSITVDTSGTYVTFVRGSGVWTGETAANAFVTFTGFTNQSNNKPIRVYSVSGATLSCYKSTRDVSVSEGPTAGISVWLSASEISLTVTVAVDTPIAGQSTFTRSAGDWTTNVKANSYVTFSGFTGGYTGNNGTFKVISVTSTDIVAAKGTTVNVTGATGISVNESYVSPGVASTDYPGTGDIFAVGYGHSITTSGTVAVGNNVTAGYLTETSSLQVGTGTTGQIFSLRGNFISGDNWNGATFKMIRGSTLNFDTATTGAVMYFGTGLNYQKTVPDIFDTSDCTSASPCIVTSTDHTKMGYFYRFQTDLASNQPQFALANTNFSYISDGTATPQFMTNGIAISIATSPRSFVANKCRFDHCGRLVINPSAVGDVTYTNNTHTNSLDTISLSIATGAVTTGSRTITGNVFDKQTVFAYFGGTGKNSPITGNVFLDMVQLLYSSPSKFNGNFVQQGSQALISTHSVYGIPSDITEGNFDGNYFRPFSTCLSYPDWHGVLGSGDTGNTVYITNNVFESGPTVITSGTEGIALLPAKGILYTYGNIVTRDASGNFGSRFLSATSPTAATRTYIHNNTIITGLLGIRTTEDTKSTEYVNELTQFQNNIIFGPGTKTAYAARDDIEVLVADTLVPSAATNNVLYNMVTTGNCTNDGGTFNCKGYIGWKFSGSNTPGANDQIDVNPNFLDDKRTLRTYDLSLGGDGIEANFLAKMAALNDGVGVYDPRYSVANLLAWVRAGFHPTNPLLVKKSADGVTDVGAMTVTLIHGRVFMFGGL